MTGKLHLIPFDVEMFIVGSHLPIKNEIVWNFVCLDICSSGSLDWKESHGEASAMTKFKLLLWKNFKMQTRHKVQTVIEFSL